MKKLQPKSIPAVKMPKGGSLTRLLVAMNVPVFTQPLREHIELARKRFIDANKASGGQSVEVNNLWNRIKKHVCRVCDGVKLRAKSDTCSHHCAMRARVLSLCFILCVSVANAQTKTNSVMSMVVQTKQSMFTWQNPAGASNVTVSWGLMRDHWTNGTRNIGISNSFPRTNGWHYVVTARVNDRESTPALWPSNRFAQYWLKDLGTNFQGARMITNETLLSTFVNKPYDGQHFWQIEDRTIKWE